MRRATARRDQAIILTLLNTGLRASELSALKVGDVDLKTGKVLVKHGRLGGAKGGKGRTVYLGKAARRAVMKISVQQFALEPRYLRAARKCCQSREYLRASDSCLRPCSRPSSWHAVMHRLRGRDETCGVIWMADLPP